MRTVVAMFLGVAGWGGAFQAQDRAQSQAPKTRMEAFEAQTGTVIIKGFSEAGVIKSPLNGILSLYSMEITDGATGKKEYGIAIDLSDGEMRSNRVFIDFEEIGSLLKGVDYATKVDKSVTTLDNFQVDFRTKGDLSFSIFNRQKETEVKVSCGSISLFFSPLDLSHFRDFVASAQEKLASLRKH